MVVSFFGLLKTVVVCGTLFFLVMLVLLALPQSKLRCVGLEMAKWVLCGAMLMMIPSPIDVIPDVVPGLGWADDIGYLIAAISTGRGALNERKKRRLLEAAEMHELEARSKGGGHLDG